MTQWHVNNVLHTWPLSVVSMIEKNIDKLLDNQDMKVSVVFDPHSDKIVGCIAQWNEDSVVVHYVSGGSAVGLFSTIAEVESALLESSKTFYCSYTLKELLDGPIGRYFEDVLKEELLNRWYNSLDDDAV